jgi:hypothetical protein
LVFCSPVHPTAIVWRVLACSRFLSWCAMAVRSARITHPNFEGRNWNIVVDRRADVHREDIVHRSRMAMARMRGLRDRFNITVCGPCADSIVLVAAGMPDTVEVVDVSKVLVCEEPVSTGDWSQRLDEEFWARKVRNGP